MEWVVTTGRSVEEAKNRALDQLGVAEDDAEFEVLEEPRAGLFGRVRGEAKVRARVRPTQPRPKLERRDRRKRGDAEPAAASDDVEAPSSPNGDTAEGAPTGRAKGRGAGRSTGERSASGGERPAGRQRGGRGRADRAADEQVPADASELGGAGAVDVIGDQGTGGAEASADAPRNGDGDGEQRGRRRRSEGSGARQQARDTVEEQEMDVDATQVGEAAREFVQGVVDAFGLQGTTSVRQEGDELDVTVDGTDLGLLVGPRGSTLQALQELTRVAAQRRLGDHDTRLRVDVAGYRERRREALTRFATQVADEVESSGTARALEPMSSADRKVVHDALADRTGVVTHSEGDDPARRVVIAPASA